MQRTQTGTLVSYPCVADLARTHIDIDVLFAVVGCTGRSERLSIDSTEVQRTREHMVRPYSLSCAAPPPSYDAIDYPETAVQTQTQVSAPEPAHLTKGASLAASHRDVVYMHMPSPSDESWTPSTAASRETIYTYTSAATDSA